MIKEEVPGQITAPKDVNRELPPRSDQHRREARMSLQTIEQLKLFTKKLPPTFPPEGIKTGLALEGGASVQVNHLPDLISDSSHTDPLPLHAPKP